METPHVTLEQMFSDYQREHLMRKGKDWKRVGSIVKCVTSFFDPKCDPTKWKHEEVEEAIDHFLEQGKHPNTIRRYFGVMKTAITHAHKRNRIAAVPHIELPDMVHTKRHPLTEEQFRVVMSKPMSGRLRRLYRLLYWTGCRSRAGEELQWSWGVDFERRIINFNPPDRRITPNKRRVDGFPIDDEFFDLLQGWKALAKDDFVIGLGPRGRCTTTYHEAAYVVRELCGFTDPLLAPRHCMRSMFATEMFDRGADPEFVGALTGDNPAMLRKHYVQIKADQLRATVRLRRTAA